MGIYIASCRRWKTAGMALRVGGSYIVQQQILMYEMPSERIYVDSWVRYTTLSTYRK